VRRSANRGYRRREPARRHRRVNGMKENVIMATETFPIDPQAVPLEWHEAVGVVQEVASRYLAGEGVMARRAGDLSVDAEGRLAIPRAKVSVFGKSVQATINETQHVSDLQALLKELLATTSVPPALSALLDAPPGSAQIGSVTEFSKALGFFERPGRARDLKIMASRQAAAHEQLALNDKLAELTRKARHEPSEPDQPMPTGTPLRAVERPGVESNEPGWEFLSEAELRRESPHAEAHQRRGTSYPTLSVAQLKQVGLLVTAISLLLVAGIVAYYAFSAVTSGEDRSQPTAQADNASGGSSALSSPTATAGKASGSLRPEVERSSRARDRQASLTRQSTTSAPGVKTTVNVAPRALAPAQNVAAGIDGSAPPSDGPALALGPLLHVAPRNTALAHMPTFLASGRVDATLVGFDQVFDAGDDKVRPARLLRPQLPEIPPGTPLEALGMFEFVVNTRGTVDRIRLVRSPVDRQYRDIMLMPAAKAWIFQPATKDGSPVRYRLQLSIPQ